MKKLARYICSILVILVLCFVGIVSIKYLKLSSVEEDVKVVDTIKSVIKKPNKEEIKKTFVRDVRKAMLERKKKVTVKYYGTTAEVKDFTDKALNMAFEIKEKNSSVDYDYLKANFKSMNAKIRGIGKNFTVEYNFKYRESKKETDEVDKEVKKIIKNKKLLKKSPYNRVLEIHDYIVENASYDTSYQKDSAYDNLILQSSVCHGYAIIAYKMLTEAKIPCRIITGKSRGEGHAWNIVKIDGKWYNLDCTWDDPVTPDKSQYTQYTYFLKSADNFPEHERDKEYDSIKFNEKYKMSEKSYNYKERIKSNKNK